MKIYGQFTRNKSTRCVHCQTETKYYWSTTLVCAWCGLREDRSKTRFRWTLKIIETVIRYVVWVYLFSFSNLAGCRGWTAIWAIPSFARLAETRISFPHRRRNATPSQNTLSMELPPHLINNPWLQKMALGPNLHNSLLLFEANWPRIRLYLWTQGCRQWSSIGSLWNR